MPWRVWNERPLLVCVHGSITLCSDSLVAACRVARESPFASLGKVGQRRPLFTMVIRAVPLGLRLSTQNNGISRFLPCV